MSIERADFDAISEQDFQELIDGQVPEGLRIEYKRELYGNSDEKKREFLKDISAFTNSIGGHLIIGIEENAGVASALPGIQNLNMDTELQRLEQIAGSGLEPRISGLRMKAVLLNNGNHILLIRVPRSWNPPHRVIAHGSNRFYIRHSAGIHEPNVEELRNLFTQTSSSLEQARRFRNERIYAIQSGSGVRPLIGGGRLIFHIVPVASFSGAISLNIEESYRQHQSFWPIGAESGMTSNYNYYGFINERGGDINYGYTQIFRNGILEATAGSIIRDFNGHHGIPCAAMEDKFFRVFHTYLTGLKNIGVSPPLILMLTLEGVQRANYYIAAHAWDQPEQILPEDVLFLPECVLEDYGEVIDYDRAIRPAFDALWNSIGYARSNYFNEEGRWTGPQRR